MATLVMQSEVGWRTENLGALLFAARNRAVQAKLAVLYGQGHAIVTDAQLALFHNLDRSGARPTLIAERAGLTKSSISELVERAVVMGLVERVADPHDGRAKRICYTPPGLAFLELLETAIAVADDGFLAAVGPVAMRHTVATLAQYAELDGTAASGNIGRLFGRAARRFVGDVLARTDGNIGEPRLMLFRALDLDGTRLTDVAARSNVTKQAMRETIALAVQAGFIEARPDPEDGRARLLAFTPTGLTVLAQLRLAVTDAERDVACLLGDPALGDLRRQLKTWLATDQAKLRPTNQ
ncbi:MarR family winged helix-turn-helix transcriptional regulator [Sphingomonas sp.]|uniref:MarR family winged helix-turn-helix transcriptional regulator n=1 Tax=Sphingomonas sp. TaxID=28214 RepID=UPI002600768B|nr:MarR family winged helix-turn-helix transcriptional regulator [Sphingomonas sp.]